MAKGDVTLVPIILESTKAEELTKMVVAERIKRNQLAARAQYSTTVVSRSNGNSYTKYTAFVEFMVEET